jgi:hypothetical protein
MLSSNGKYIGLDVHKEAVAIAVLNGAGKLMMESIVETKASTLLDFLHGLRGELHVTLEEGTWAAWLYDVLKPQVAELVVCNPRRNALLKKAARATRWRHGSWPNCADCRNLFLRKQLAFYQERQIHPRRLTNAARLSLVFWSRFFAWKFALTVVKPATLIGWHRKAFQQFWKRSQGRGDGQSR